jgi:hypothetical protein
MAGISGFLCEVITSDFAGAGTDGSIYLGICGREFHLDSTRDDFERGSFRDYILGEPPIELGPPPPDHVHVNDREKNDPRVGFPLDTDNLNLTPVYVRFEPENSGDNWNINFAAVLVFTDKFVVGYTPPAGFDNLWLGHASGKILYLTFEHRVEARTLADARSKLADRLGKRLPKS